LPQAGDTAKTFNRKEKKIAVSERDARTDTQHDEKRLDLYLTNRWLLTLVKRN
jgi:hypothetical protein